MNEHEDKLAPIDHDINATQLFPMIRSWAAEKGIYAQGDVKTQALKLLEEAGELAKAILNEDLGEMIDAIGDCGVVLTNVAALVDRDYALDQGHDEVTFESCMNVSYRVIASRTGRMENGTFIKDK